MKYYVTICIAGDMDEEDCYNTLEEAMAVRAERDAHDISTGKHEPGFWIVVDENGKEQAWK